MPEGAVFGPYDKPMKMEFEKFAGFLRDVAVCVGEHDSMEGRIAYEWGVEVGVLNVCAFVRTGNSMGQGGAWVLQDNEAAEDAADDRETDERDGVIPLPEPAVLATKANMRAYAQPGLVMISTAEQLVHYSANPNDYWMVGENEILPDAYNEAQILVVKRTVYETPERTDGKLGDG